MYKSLVSYYICYILTKDFTYEIQRLSKCG